MPNAKPLPVLILVLALSGCSSGSVLDAITSKGEQDTSLNGFRATNGRKALAQDAHLTALAGAHAADMARRNSLDHNGFMEKRGPAGARAENVAYGCADTPCVIQMWINSPGHRTNMLRADVTKYGLASATSTSGRRYWALELGE